MSPFYSLYPPPPGERRWRPRLEELAPNCPRCHSSNTKFCYYNNYCLSQPRYLCKGCRRYWTKGGSLRNIPVGGGCRKSRRGKSAKPDSTVSSSLSSPPKSFRPDHALENMSGRTATALLSPEFFAPSNNFVGNRFFNEEFVDVQGSGLGEVMGYNNDYLVGSSDYGLETDLMLV